jgi:uncharacterized membrane protein YukC
MQTLTFILLITLALSIAFIICFVIYSLFVDGSKAKRVISSIKEFFDCDYSNFNIPGGIA